ncbi:hypothetical protein [Pseudomonas luteola]|uniref:hypothetical protein n=1 Tax=Pseudomonas luteola TaxID=47886 RepID=UPI0015E476C5|nr:hypothetical protein [Pseudomonas zeshuii]MBA1249889.1 hypothetical protein [Pseudomonas zeshuii]
MSKTVILTGTAIVSFRKVMRLPDDEFEEFEHDIDTQEAQVDQDDLLHIESINEINMEVKS